MVYKYTVLWPEYYPSHYSYTYWSLAMYLALVSLVLVYFSGSILYRLFLHPLHKYPGPILAVFSGGYQAYFNQIRGGEWIERLHNVYGPIVRVGPNKLHFNSPQAFHDIYTNGHSLRKDPGMYTHGVATIASESAWAAMDLQKAKYRRGLMAPLFSRRAIVELEYTVQQKIDKLLAVFEEHYSSPGSTIEMSPAFRSLTTDIINSYCFAECPDTLDYPDSAILLFEMLKSFFRQGGRNENDRVQNPGRAGVRRFDDLSTLSRMLKSLFESFLGVPSALFSLSCLF
ncbi:hypothetical protein D9757_012820 [Collybiopsis confluens]|uniref:Cytochrome P450 n=1 Tax=Collybiopsis confluens TaxID=2823264 RepID=A0A8H5G0A0_9AGAR|nr:hypothetical protein D9757_012820 [Collybiopsis confluens]